MKSLTKPVRHSGLLCPPHGGLQGAAGAPAADRPSALHHGQPFPVKGPLCILVIFACLNLCSSISVSSVLGLSHCTSSGLYTCILIFPLPHLLSFLSQWILDLAFV